MDDPEEQARRLSFSLARFKRPRLYRFVEELPRTATGKKQPFVMKQRSVEDLAEGRFVRP